MSESLTNVAKHPQSSLAGVDVTALQHAVRVTVSDDGTGGGDPARGTGLTGLTDRIQAAGGTISIHSPPGAGTHLEAELPFG